jgi:DNA-binding NtrC family response regulator
MDLTTLPGSKKVLIADDEKEMRWMLSTLLREEGFLTVEAQDGRSALELIREEIIDVILLDIKLPDMNGIEVLKKSVACGKNIPTIVITAFGSIQSAVDAVKNGASHYLTKPFDTHQLLQTIRAVTREYRGCGNKKEKNKHSLLEEMGSSRSIRKVIEDVALVATTGFGVLITGETGTGKELVTRAIHRASRRASGPFVPVDCQCIPSTLIESELFGHQKGSFTGADRTRPGSFEIASGGTLFLDEICNLPLAVQAKLLRVLQEKEIRSIGSSGCKKVDVRVIAATNQDLKVLVEANTFRPDLYHRLNEFEIRIPPLREREEDIIYLAQRFLRQTNAELDKKVEISGPAMAALVCHPWPGNVRELQNVIRRAVLLANGVIETEHLPILTPAPEPGGSPGEPMKEGSLKEIVRRNVAGVERDAILRVLKETGGNKAQAARQLHIDYKTILTKIQEYGIKFYKTGGNTNG